jgi:hypothetical protein
MFSATPYLLSKAPNNLTGVKGTEAYSMEARQLRHEERCRYAPRGVSLVVAFLLCLGVFLQLSPATGSEVPSAVTMADLPSVELLANGKGYPLDETYLVAPVVEAEGSDKDPLNAELLTMLLLTAFFGRSSDGCSRMFRGREHYALLRSWVRRWPARARTYPS